MNTRAKINCFAEFLNMLRQDYHQNSFTAISSYKMHYILCVQSVSQELSGGKSLFDIFDNFRAMKNGPMEWDIYKNRDIIPGWFFDINTGAFVHNGTKKPVISPEFKMILEKAHQDILPLFDSQKYPTDHETYPRGITEFTRNLPLWKHAYNKYGEQTRLLTKNHENRKLEYDAYVKERDRLMQKEFNLQKSK